MEFDKSIEALVNLGWSEYESKVYSALLISGQATASQIATSSSVPANRVYQVLGKLSEKGYVYKVQGKGKPTIFFAKNSKEILAEISENYADLVKTAESALLQIQERSKRQENPISFTISGRKELNAHMTSMLRATQNSAYLVLDTLAELNLGKISSLLLKRFHEGKIIYILTQNQGINDEYEKEALKGINPIEVRVSNEPFTNIVLISDSLRVIFATYANISTNENVDEKNFVGLYAEDKPLALMFEKIFKDAWVNGENTRELI